MTTRFFTKCIHIYIRYMIFFGVVLQSALYCICFVMEMIHYDKKNNNQFLSSPFLSLNFSLFHDKIVVRVIRLRSAEQTANGKIIFSPKFPNYCPKKPKYLSKSPKRYPFLYYISFCSPFPGFNDKKPKVEYLPILPTTYQSSYSPSTIHNLHV